ncbi:MAG: RDD family protein [Brevinemataceae bacterium]
MFEINSQKIKALKLAPWWKRLLSYMIDNVFLTLFLVMFILGIYGKEFVEIFDNIKAIGGENLLLQENINSDVIQSRMKTISKLSVEDKETFYFFWIIQKKYSYAIFLLTQIISSLYFILMWHGTGQTFGGKLLKIKVITTVGGKISLYASIIRLLGLKFIEMTWGFAGIFNINKTFKQKIHDIISDSVVVEEFSPIEEKFLEEHLKNSAMNIKLSSEQDNPVENEHSHNKK